MSSRRGKILGRAGSAKNDKNVRLTAGGVVSNLIQRSPYGMQARRLQVMQSLSRFLNDSPIMVVDDDREARTFVRALLKATALDNRVLECGDPEQALELLNDLAARAAP